MSPDLDEKLVKHFPLLYSDRHSRSTSTGMCRGFCCGDGWFDIIWDLSKELEKHVAKFIEENPNLICSNCGCKKSKHHGSMTKQPGRCLAIHADPYSDAEPPGNYYSCFCDAYKGSFPRASQVKEKFGGLRFYMTAGNDEIYELISKAESLSFKVCEDCGGQGKSRKSSSIRTLCDKCFDD